MLNQRLLEGIDAHRDHLVAISRQIHGLAEVAFEEVESSKIVASHLADNGFSVRVGVADLPTAFDAHIGSGTLEVGICAEYDALPGIGHGCGHNVIAASAVGAAVALAPFVDELDLKIRVLGTPAEEGGSGKIYMLQRGAFDGLHAAVMVHPAPYDSPVFNSLAAQAFDVSYRGRSAHASASAHLGINAADALTVAQVGVGLLRQHILPTDRIHGIVTDGGDAPNVVPERTSGRWYARSATLAQLHELMPRLRQCFQAGALATGCELEFATPHPARSEFRDCADLSEHFQKVQSELGRTYADFHERGSLSGSTDMANVSMVMPAIHPMIGIETQGAALHSPGFAAAAVSDSANLAIRDGAAGLAVTIARAATDLSLRRDLSRTRFVAREVDSPAF